MVAALVVAAVAAGASAYESKKASDAQAKLATSTANYNAQVDVANAQQLAMDASANIDKQRRDDASYMSNQRAAYAASGVLSGTGSPMTVEATTAGRMEQDIQQYWTSVQEKESTLYAAASMDVLEGQDTAEIYHLQGTADIFKGIGSVASIAGQAYSARA